MGKFADIVERYTPKGWKVVQQAPKDKRKVALCSYQKRTIWCPKVNCAKHAQYFLHEIAHAKLHYGSLQPKHVEEYEAEMWSFARLIQEGVPVSRLMIRAAQMNVLAKIWSDKKNRKPIDPEVQAWVHPRRCA